MKLFTKVNQWRSKGGVRPWLYLPFAFCAYAGLDLALRYAYREFGMWNTLHPAPNIATIGWCLILLAVSLVLPGKVRKVYLGVSVLFFAVLTVTHSVLRILFRRFFMFSTLAFAGDGLAFADSSYIKVHPIVIVGVILALLFMAAAIVLAPSKGQMKPVRAFIAGILAAAVGVFGIFMVHDRWLSSSGVLKWDIYSDPAAVYESFTDSTRALLMSGLYQYTAKDLGLSLHIGSGVSSEERQELEAFVQEQRVPRPDNDHTGIFEGKNLILVQLEAIDTWMLSEDYMPTLWGLKQESMVFENHYSPAYITAGTLNSEFMANTGLLPATGNVSTRVYVRNQYPYSLANMLRSAGYSAQSFHGSEGDVYNRGAFHPAVGYEVYNSGSDMGMEDFTMDRYLMAGYDDMVREDPFMSFVITYSGHGPYNMKNGAYLAHAERAHALAESNGLYLYAVAGAMETDEFVGDLVTALERDGVLDDTVLVFYADHYNYYMNDDGLNMELKGVGYMDLLQHTDFFIYSKDREPEVVTKFTSTLDILPTLANLFALDDDGAVYFGNDAFSDGGDYVFFVGSSWVDSDLYWIFGDPVDEEIVQRNEEIAEKFRMSNLILQSDYFAVK